MAFNLKNRNFLKEIDFEPRELGYLLKLSEALKLAKYAWAPRSSTSKARRSR